MKKLIVFSVTVFSVAALVSLMAFNSDVKDPAQGYILIEIYEVPSYPDRGVHIHYGGNKREFIPFTGMEVEHHDEAGDITLAAINKLFAEGYEIESTSAGLDQAGMITKIFMRKK